MKFYISGKISDATREKFAKAEEMLKAKWHIVFNPCDERWQRILKREYEHDNYIQSPWLTDKFPDFYTYCLLRDQMVLSTKDAVLMLEDWADSPGAQSEYHFAKATKKTIFFAKREDAVIYLEERWKEGNKVVKTRVPRWKYVENHLHKVWLPIE